ncbi:MAG: hypothetical protein HOM11_13895 [Methylococcales bacterium]|jgi:hypothetical protein|nr:hypothetical protein [Methylococcales bacterium]MBT7444158.1 hypothetical protein [Methylococcales bacterium]
MSKLNISVLQRKFQMCCWIALTFLGSSSVAMAENTLSALPVGSFVEVSYSSSGCFHSFGNNLVIRVDDEVTAELADEDHSRASMLRLSAEDVAGLDAQLEFYRKVKEGGCTTVDHITFKWHLPGESVEVEEHVDDTCTGVAGLSYNRLITKLESLMLPIKAKQLKWEKR